MAAAMFSSLLYYGCHHRGAATTAAHVTTYTRRTLGEAQRSSPGSEETLLRLRPPKQSSLAGRAGQGIARQTRGPKDHRVTEESVGTAKAEAASVPNI